MRYARPERGEARAVDHAIEHSFVREAVVPERKLVTEALKRGLGRGHGRGRGPGDEAASADPQRRSTGGKMATTKEMLALESQG